MSLNGSTEENLICKAMPWACQMQVRPQPLSQVLQLWNIPRNLLTANDLHYHHLSSTTFIIFNSGFSSLA